MTTMAPPAPSSKSTISTFIRLKWALTLSSLRSSPWQIVGFVVCCVLCLGVLTGTAIGAFFLGTPLVMQEIGAMMPFIMVLGGTMAILFAVVLQAMIIGEGSTMTMDRFVPYGIPDRTVQAGLIISGFTGLASLTATVSLIIWSMAYREYGAGAVLAQILMAPCIVMLTMCFCKMMLALLDSLVDTQTGKTVFYIVTVVLMVVLAQLPNIMIHSGIQFSDTDLSAAHNVLAWLPLGTLFAIPFDVAAGSWGFAIARFAIALIAAIACFAVATWCLKRQRQRTGLRSSAKSAKGIGIFAHTTDSPSGAISACVLTRLRRDVRQSMIIVLPILFVVIFLLQSHEVGSWFAWMGVGIAGWVMAMSESNGLAYEGRGYAMEVIAGTPASADRIGRVRAFITFGAIYFVILAVFTCVIAQSWKSSFDLLLGACFTVGGFSWFLASLGISEVMNASTMYPVPSIEKPFVNPPGRTVSQMFIPLLYMLASIVVMAPTFIALILLIINGEGLTFLWIMPIALLNGIAICVLGTWLGAKLLHTRRLQVLHTLDKFASLQQ